MSGPDECPFLHSRLGCMLYAARPYLSPEWYPAADSLMSTVEFMKVFHTLRGGGFSSIMKGCRGHSPVTEPDSLMSAVRPFCLPPELQIMNLFSRYLQMKQMMDLFSVFSSMMPEGSDPFGGTASDPGKMSEILAALGGADTNQMSKILAALSGADTNQMSEILAALSGADTNQMSEILAALGGVDTNQMSEILAALGGVDNNQMSEILAALGGVKKAAPQPPD